MAIGKFKLKKSEIWAVQWKYENKFEVDEILNKNLKLFERYVIDNEMVFFYESQIDDNIIRRDSWLISDNKDFNNWDGKVLSDKDFKELYEFAGYYAVSI